MWHVRYHGYKQKRTGTIMNFEQQLVFSTNLSMDYKNKRLSVIKNWISTHSQTKKRDSQRVERLTELCNILQQTICSSRHLEEQIKNLPGILIIALQFIIVWLRYQFDSCGNLSERKRINQSVRLTTLVAINIFASWTFVRMVALENQLQTGTIITYWEIIRRGRRNTIS